jgi:hypothetical protein
MRHAFLSATACAVLMLTTGCVVAPARHGGVVMEPAAVYVEPADASPGVGWEWRVHPRFGWGWHHPHNGWHRGWR